MTSYSPNSVLWIHHEFEGGVRVDLYILYFAQMLGAFLYIAHLYMYYILWPLAPWEYKLLIPNMVSEQG